MNRDNSDTFDKSSGASEEELRRGGDLKVRQNKTVNWIARFGCLLAAFMVWVFAMASDNPTFEQEFVALPIEIINESGLSVLSSSTSSANVTVVGKRSLVSKLSVSDFSAYIHLTREANGSAGRYELPISFNLPAGVTLAPSTSGTVTVYLDNTASRGIPVHVKISDYILEEGYELGDLSVDISEVWVTGPAAELDDIAYAQIGVSLGHLTRSLTCSGALVLVDASGSQVTSSYLKLNNTTATVTVPVLQNKTIPLGVTYKYGYFNDSNAAVTIEPTTLLVKGEADRVEGLSWSCEIDEKLFSSDGTYHMALTLPAGVTSVEGVDSVSVSVRHIGTRIRDMTLTEFEVLNPDFLSYELCVDNLPIRLRGDSRLIDRISSSDITATVDLSGAPASNGLALLPVNFSFGGMFGGSVYELGTYSVPVRITG